MSGTGPWIGGGLMGLLSLFGLFMAARAVDPPFEVAGYLVFIGSLSYIFSMVKRYYDRMDAERHG